MQQFPKEPDLHNSLGALLFRERRFDEAVKELEIARAQAPHVAMPHYNLGLLHFERAEFSQAAASLERAVEIEPKRPMYHFTLARAYRAGFEFAASAEAFKRASSSAPPPPMARMARLELALALKHQGLLHESARELDRLLEADPRDPEALFQLGRVHLSMNRYPRRKTSSSGSWRRARRTVPLISCWVSSRIAATTPREP